MRPASCGFATLDQIAASTGFSAEPPTLSRSSEPESASPTGRARHGKWHFEQLHVALALGEEQHALAIGSNLVVADGVLEARGEQLPIASDASSSAQPRGHVHHFFDFGCTFASSIEPSRVNWGAA